MFPKKRKPAKISNLEILNAGLYVVENGCKWRRLPKEYGDWHVIYVRPNRWAKKRVLQASFPRLQQLRIIHVQVNVMSLDSTCIKVHSDGMGALKKVAHSPSEEHGAGGKLHMVAASDRDGVMFALSAGNCGDSPEGRALMQKLGPAVHPVYLLMDRAYEEDETRALAAELGYIPVVPPKLIAKIHGALISICTGSAIRLSNFFATSKDFVAFSLAIINLMLSF